jgi:hypothetical protein
MEHSIAVWEEEGGLQPGIDESAMTGTANQIVWALQIRRNVDAEFDRVRNALESVRQKRPVLRHTQIEALLAILEDKRAEVMRRTDAGYFIHDWQDLRNHVRRLIIEDSRYKAITS